MTSNVQLGEMPGVDRHHGSHESVELASSSTPAIVTTAPQPQPPMSAGNHNTTDQPTTISSTVDSSPVILPLSPQQTESTSQPQPQTHPSPSPLPNLPVLSLPLDTTVTQTSEDGRTHQQHQHNNKDKKREGYWCLCVPPKVKRKVVGNISCSMGPCSCYAQGSGFMGTSGCCCLWPIVAISGFSWGIIHCLTCGCCSICG